MVGYALDYRITANNDDITSLLQKYCAQITVTDAAGYQSDSLSITLNDPGIAMPQTGAELCVAMGDKGALTPMGKYIVDEVGLSFPPHTMTISANAAPFEGSSSGCSPLQSQRQRSFKACTLKELVCSIATEHRLEVAVSEKLGLIKLDHIDQMDESDIHLLTRIAKEYDAIAKVNGGTILFVERGAGYNSRGEPMPVVHLSQEQVTRGSAKISLRGAFKKIVSTYRDIAAAKDVEVVAGEGDPVYRIKGVYSNKETALQAAKQRLAFYERGKWTLSLSLPFTPELVAESRIVLDGFRTGINGTWSVTKATHSMSSSGATTSIEGERPVSG
ncbi:contractile injection system protein, VgrG/Pvc8 family [Halodesulfovibrio sp.]|uniref:contractile injection system protein, VgrG/Pvc8 family n=1 Tax=Halodesulfovibrio sp. TaxID=1912772 RepID=UPI0025C26475|nr:contractile injection system protein, VgrG/Pvc8 family [Halodesulfovibrio sp.]